MKSLTDEKREYLIQCRENLANVPDDHVRLESFEDEVIIENNKKFCDKLLTVIILLII